LCIALLETKVILVQISAGRVGGPRTAHISIHLPTFSLGNHRVALRKILVAY